MQGCDRRTPIFYSKAGIGFVTVVCFLPLLGRNHNTGTLTVLNVYRTENPCITKSNGKL